MITLNCLQKQATTWGYAYTTVVKEVEDNILLSILNKNINPFAPIAVVNTGQLNPSPIESASNAPTVVFYDAEKLLEFVSPQSMRFLVSDNNSNTTQDVWETVYIEGTAQIRKENLKIIGDRDLSGVLTAYNSHETQNSWPSAIYCQDEDPYVEIPEMPGIYGKQSDKWLAVCEKGGNKSYLIRNSSYAVLSNLRAGNQSLAEEWLKDANSGKVYGATGTVQITLSVGPTLPGVLRRACPEFTKEKGIKSLVDVSGTMSEKVKALTVFLEKNTLFTDDYLYLDSDISGDMIPSLPMNITCELHARGMNRGNQGKSDIAISSKMFQPLPSRIPNHGNTVWSRLAVADDTRVDAAGISIKLS